MDGFDGSLYAFTLAGAVGSINDRLVDQRGRYSNLLASRLRTLFGRPEWRDMVDELHQLLIRSRK